jgi:hypothetical protein
MHSIRLFFSCFKMASQFAATAFAVLARAVAGDRHQFAELIVEPVQSFKLRGDDLDDTVDGQRAGSPSDLGDRVCPVSAPAQGEPKRPCQFGAAAAALQGDPVHPEGVPFALRLCREASARTPYAPNPFAELEPDRMVVEDGKPAFVFE